MNVLKVGMGQFPETGLRRGPRDPPPRAETEAAE